MQASILQKGYVHPRRNLSTKSITLKEDWQTYPLSQGEKKVLIIISLIFASKTLLLLPHQTVQKIACGINETLFSLTSYQKHPPKPKDDSPQNQKQPKKPPSNNRLTPK